MSDYLQLEQLVALIKAKRGKKGLRETAAEIGEISASTLSRIENGKTPDLETFLRLCDWLEISPDQFTKINNSSHERQVPISSGMSTPEIIEAHLRADKELDPKTAEALAEMVRATYNAIRAGKVGRKKEQ